MPCDGDHFGNHFKFPHDATKGHVVNIWRESVSNIEEGRKKKSICFRFATGLHANLCLVMSDVWWIFLRIFDHFLLSHACTECQIIQNERQIETKITNLVIITLQTMLP
jgi:hypothetical protein